MRQKKIHTSAYLIKETPYIEISKVNGTIYKINREK